MRGQTARLLRKIAKGGDLPLETGYAPGGSLRRRPAHKSPLDGAYHPGPPIPRPTVMTLCFRRAYKEAKKIFKGLPVSICVSEKEVAETAKSAPFRVRVADSIRKFHAQD
jgi:hypothetical protein